MALPFYTDEINTASNRYGVPADLLRSVIKVESGGDKYAVGRAGEKGLMQIMDGTARDLGLNDPFDPAENIMAGAKYLSQQYKKAGNWREALARYNGGKYYAGSQAQGYADKVINEYTSAGGDSGLMNAGTSSASLPESDNTGFKGKMCIDGVCLDSAPGDVDTSGIEGSADIPEWLKAILKWVADNALKLALIVAAVIIFIFGIWRLINANK